MGQAATGRSFPDGDVGQSHASDAFQKELIRTSRLASKVGEESRRMKTADQPRPPSLMCLPGWPLAEVKMIVVSV